MNPERDASKEAAPPLARGKKQKIVLAGINHIFVFIAMEKPVRRREESPLAQWLSSCTISFNTYHHEWRWWRVVYFPISSDRRCLNLDSQDYRINMIEKMYEP